MIKDTLNDLSKNESIVFDSVSDVSNLFSLFNLLEHIFNPV